MHGAKAVHPGRRPAAAADRGDHRLVEQLSDAELHAIIASAQRDADQAKLIEGELVAEEKAPRPLDVEANVGRAESDGEKPN
jgi:hypothetical protein